MYGSSVLEDFAKRNSPGNINLEAAARKSTPGRLWTDRISINIGAMILARRSGKLNKINPRGSNKSFCKRFVALHIETLCNVLVYAGKRLSVTNEVNRIARAGNLIAFSTD